jgi:hypothetical protein
MLNKRLDRIQSEAGRSDEWRNLVSLGGNRIMIRKLSKPYPNHYPDHDNLFYVL